MKSTFDNNTIKLDISPSCQMIKGVAAEEIDPGMLLSYRKAITANGNSYFSFIRHHIVDGSSEMLVAFENVLEGKTIVSKYDTGTSVQAVALKRGDIYLGLVDEIVVNVGDRLSSSGNGLLKVPATPGLYRSCVALALEEYDLGAVPPPRLTRLVVI